MDRKLFPRLARTTIYRFKACPAPQPPVPDVGWQGKLLSLSSVCPQGGYGLALGPSPVAVGFRGRPPHRGWPWVMATSAPTTGSLSLRAWTAVRVHWQLDTEVLVGFCQGVLFLCRKKQCPLSSGNVGSACGGQTEVRGSFLAGACRGGSAGCSCRGNGAEPRKSLSRCLCPCDGATSVIRLWPEWLRGEQCLPREPPDCLVPGQGGCLGLFTAEARGV